jgi:hypothetical protein
VFGACRITADGVDDVEKRQNNGDFKILMEVYLDK